jgi:hypothetical protein
MTKKRGRAMLSWMGALSLLLAGGSSARADQQQWASQYVNWKADGKVSQVYNIDQEVWLPQPNTTSYWPLQFGFIGVSGGAYIGLQQADTGGGQNARFSIWNATKATGTNCKPFGGEGVGQTCTLNVTIDPKKFYRLRVWKQNTEADGQWWGGWLIEADSSGKLIEHAIGSIKAPVGASFIDPKSLSNFVEFWGQHITPCKNVPLSVVGFTPPAVNYNGAGTGSYRGYYTYGDSIKAQGNQCTTGGEGDGALITAKPYNFGFSSGVMMFLGGPSTQPILDRSAGSY